MNWEVCEFKTHNAKSFKSLTENGVKTSKPQHFYQMQTYMHLTGMTRANYLAVCKDDDSLYYERIHADESGSEMVDLAEKIIFSSEIPSKLNQDPAWFECKICDYQNNCHGTSAPVPTCRSCAHSTPLRDGGWMCEFHNISIDYDAQVKGCDSHRIIPHLITNFAEIIDASNDGNWVKYRNTLTGNEFTNGELSSAEIYACQDKRSLGDASVMHVRKMYDGTLVG